jgi:uncharacterized membrane protein
LLLFVGSWYLRYSSIESTPYLPSTLAMALSFSGFILSAVTGWLGGELVDRLSVGVDDGANLDAPNSITHSRVSRPMR